MGFWSRIWGRGGKPEDPKDEENLLVISDVHLGEDVVANGPDHLGDYIRALNRELRDFVAHHRQHAEDGRRWHLVANGDLFDFVKVSLAGEMQRWEEAATGSLGGRSNTADDVVWKLRRVVDIHRPLFKELAGFLLDGHRFTIVEGNHDAEFYFEKVRNALTEYLVEQAGRLHRAQGRVEVFDGEAVAGGIAYKAWFLASPGRYHIEHGHQYDEHSSFEYNLAPLERVDANTLATPFSHRLMLQVAGSLGDFSSHGIDTWTFGKYLRFVVSRGHRVGLKLAAAYFKVAVDLAWRAGARRRQELAALQEHHAERLRTLTREEPYGEQTLVALDALKARPAELSTWKTAQTYYLDRFLALALSGIAVVAGGIVGGWEGWLGAGGAVLVGVVGQCLLSRWRRTDMGELLRSKAAKIAAVTGARYVVFGHSHNADVVDLRERFGAGKYGERAYYLNTGSWVTREVLLRGQGRGMTYVEITGQGARLLRWIGDEGPPVQLGSTHPGGSEAV